MTSPSDAADLDELVREALNRRALQGDKSASTALQYQSSRQAAESTSPPLSKSNSNSSSAPSESYTPDSTFPSEAEGKGDEGDTTVGTPSSSARSSPSSVSTPLSSSLPPSSPSSVSVSHRPAPPPKPRDSSARPVVPRRTGKVATPPVQPLLFLLSDDVPMFSEYLRPQKRRCLAMHALSPRPITSPLRKPKAAEELVEADPQLKAEVNALAEAELLAAEPESPPARRVWGASQRLRTKLKKDQEEYIGPLLEKVVKAEMTADVRPFGRASPTPPLPPPPPTAPPYGGGHKTSNPRKVSLKRFVQRIYHRDIEVRERHRAQLLMKLQNEDDKERKKVEPRPLGELIEHLHTQPLTRKKAVSEALARKYGPTPPKHSPRVSLGDLLDRVYRGPAKLQQARAKEIERKYMSERSPKRLTSQEQRDGIRRLYEQEMVKSREAARARREEMERDRAKNTRVLTAAEIKRSADLLTKRRDEGYRRE